MQCLCFCRRDLVHICKPAVKMITVVLVVVVAGEEEEEWFARKHRLSKVQFVTKI